MTAPIVIRCRKSYLVRFKDKIHLRNIPANWKLVIAIFGNPAGRYSYSIKDSPDPLEQLEIEKIFRVTA